VGNYFRYRIGGFVLNGIYLLNPTGCALVGYGPKCYGRLTGGHIINKSKVGGNKEGRAILIAQAKLFIETGIAEIMTPQCVAHNVNRWADEPEAVKIMLLQKIYEFGFLHMEEWFETFLSTFKVRSYVHYLELRVLIS